MTKTRRENLKWDGVIGSLTSATIAANSLPETDEAVVRWCPVSFECSQALLKQGFPHSENKHKPGAVSEATDDLPMWKESPIYGLFSKS